MKSNSLFKHILPLKRLYNAPSDLQGKRVIIYTTLKCIRVYWISRNILHLSAEVCIEYQINSFVNIRCEEAAVNRNETLNKWNQFKQIIIK